MSADLDDLIFKHLRGDATEAEMAELRRHVELNPKLVGRIFAASETEQDLARLAAAPTEAAPVVREKKSRRIRSSRRSRKIVRREASYFWPGLVAASVLIGAAWFVFSSKDPGTTVVVAQAVARVEDVSGDVAVISIKDKETQAAQGLQLNELEGLRTGPQGSAVIVYADGTRLNVRGQTHLQALSLKNGKSLRLTDGNVQATVAKQPPGQPFVLRTPNAEAEVLGTVLNLSASRGLTRLDVLEGSVRLTRDDKATAVVAAGHSATAMAGKELRSTKLTPLDTEGSVTINFGPSGVTVPQGALNDAGETFDPERGYGWEGPKDGPQIPGATFTDSEGVVKQFYKGRVATQAKKNPDILRDTIVTAGWGNSTETWRMPCANGTYLVTVCVGEFYCDQGPHHVRIEDQQVINAEMTAQNAWLEKKDIPVEVKDGELTMIVGGHKSDKTASDRSSDTALCFIKVKRVEPAQK